MVIGVAKFAVKQYEDSPSNIPVSAWVYPQDSVTGFRNYSRCTCYCKNFLRLYRSLSLQQAGQCTIHNNLWSKWKNASAIFYFEELWAEEKQAEWKTCWLTK